MSAHRSVSGELWFWLWQLLVTAALPFVFARLWWRGRQDRRYRQHLHERLGLGPAGIGKVWIHAVSVGEAQAALRLIEALGCPPGDLLLTTTTPTGRALLEQQLPDTVVRYAPVDWWPAIDVFFGRHRPRLLVLVETELWPGWLRAGDARQIPTVLVNGRLASRSASGYRRAGALGREMFARLNACLCITEADARAFRALGVAADRLQVTGNMKFDRPPPRPVDWLTDLPDWLVIAASTHQPEEPLILDAIMSLRQTCDTPIGLLLAPRHPHRAPELVEACRARAMSARLRSERASGLPMDVVVLDTLGELADGYATARAGLIGGTWTAVGGHTPIEAAVAGVPALCGPHTFKITALVDELSAAKALVPCGSAAAITEQLRRWMDHEPARRTAADAALQVAHRHQGAAAHTAAAIHKQLATKPPIDHA